MSDSRYYFLDAELPAASEELWGLYCHEQGCLGSQVLEEQAGRMQVRYYFDGPSALGNEQWLEGFRTRFPDCPPPGRLQWHEALREPWVSQWQRHFAPLPVGRNLLVCPPWEVPQRAEWAQRLRLVIEPGQGFGTGRHASTALALGLLERHLEGAAPLPPCIVDIGTGSGILALAARRLGVPRAIALDIDGRVGPEVRRNFALNGLAAPVLVQGAPPCLRGSYPLVVANITAPVLLEFSAVLAALTSPRGHLILSGMLQDEVPPVERAYRALGTRILQQDRAGGWAALLIQRTD